MEQYHNKHEGERVFVLGTGPSLRDTPWEKLDNEYTIAMNSIHLVYEETDWRPDYFVQYDLACEDYMNISEQRIELMKDSVSANIEDNLTMFLSNAAEKYFGEQSNIYYYNWERVKEETKTTAIKTQEVSDIWSNDITEKIYNFGGTMSVALQIANYMGFDKIYLLGCDLYIEYRPYLIFDGATDPHGYGKESNKLQGFVHLLADSESPLKSAINALSYLVWKNLPARLLTDPNHFDPQYSPKGVKYAEKANASANKVHNLYNVAGIENDFTIYNATEGGELEAHERVELNRVLQA